MAQQYAFGPFKLDERERQLIRRGQVVHLQPKSFDVLLYLLERAGKLVEKREVLDAVWKDAIVTENSLTACIRQIRIALGDNVESPDFIETIPVSGYRFIAEVRSPDNNKASTAQLQQDAPTRPKVVATNFRLMGVGVLISMLVLLIVYLVYDEKITHPPREDVTVSTRNSNLGINEGTSSKTREWEMSTAVLPFVNMSDDPGNEYFSDGLSEEILNLLAKTPSLKVIGRTSSFAFKGKNEDLRAIGEILGVETVIDGSVRRSGDQIRITAQLIDVSDGAHIWSETYNRTMTDIFDVQDDVAAAIIEALRIQIGVLPTRGRPTESPESYALFLKARAEMNAFDIEGSQQILKRAIELDPGFAEAYELLAFSYWSGSGIEAEAAQRLSNEAAANAIALDPDLVFARALYEASVFGPKIRFRKILAFEQAERTHPDNPLVLDALAFLLTENGYHEEALLIAEQFVQLDPLSMHANIHRALNLYAVGRTNEAISALEFTDQLDMQPNMWKWAIEGINLVENRDEAAIAYFESWLKQHDYPNSSWCRDLITGARDPVSGQAYLDRRIPEILATIPEGDVFDWADELKSLYLYFGFHDRYFELILDTGPNDSVWGYAGSHIWRSNIFRRVGFTADNNYLKIIKLLGISDTWEQRGAPDFCDKVSDQWVCE